MSSYKSKSPVHNMEAETLKEEIQELELRIAKLEEGLEIKEETTAQLSEYLSGSVKPVLKDHSRDSQIMV